MLSVFMVNKGLESIESRREVTRVMGAWIGDSSESLMGGGEAWCVAGDVDFLRADTPKVLN